MKTFLIITALLLALNYTGDQLFSAGFFNWTAVCGVLMYFVFTMPVYWKVAGWWVKHENRAS